jgi:mannose-6-phosphate isomerase-like protein (cupin superfamily)
LNLSSENLGRLSHAITEGHKNISIGEVNGHCLRLAVLQDLTFAWHSHPNSDEMFIVLEGELTIEFQDQTSVVLSNNDFFTVPAGKIHRTIGRGRTVNLCFESKDSETVFV